MMRQIKLVIEYDGTEYAGWQVQPNGLAIQQVLEDVLAEVARLRDAGKIAVITQRDYCERSPAG